MSISQSNIKKFQDILDKRKTRKKVESLVTNKENALRLDNFDHIIRSHKSKSKNKDGKKS